MHTVKKVLLGIVVLSVVLTTMVFMLENQQSVALTFFGWSAPGVSVAVPVILALLLGMLIGPLLTWIVRLKKGRSPRSI